MPNRTQDARSSLPWNEDLPSERMAGAEFVLPWLIDRFSGMLAILHGRFTPAEAWLIVEMHEHVTPGNPLIGGCAFCVWCDNPTCMTEDEVADAIRPLLAAHAEKAWNGQ